MDCVRRSPRRHFLLAVLTLAALISFPRAWAAVNTWTSLGPDGGRVSTIVFHNSSPNIVYALALSGFYRSTDGGAHWQQNRDGLAPRATALAVDPTNSDRVYLATSVAGKGLFVSNDAGLTFSTLHSFESPSTAAAPYAVAVSANGRHALCPRRPKCGLPKRRQGTNLATANGPAGALGGRRWHTQEIPGRPFRRSHGVRRSLGKRGGHPRRRWLMGRHHAARRTRDRRLRCRSDGQQPAVGRRRGRFELQRQSGQLMDDCVWGLDASHRARSKVAIDRLRRRFRRRYHQEPQWHPMVRHRRSGVFYPYVMAVSPHDSSTLLVGNLRGLSVTKNGGTSWARSDVGLVASAVNMLAPSSAHGRVYASGEFIGTLADGSDSVSLLDEDAFYRTFGGRGSPFLLTPTGDGPGGLLAAGPNRIGRSTDDGITWSPTTYSPDTSEWLVALAATSTLPSVYYASSDRTREDRPTRAPTGPDYQRAAQRVLGRRHRHCSQQRLDPVCRTAAAAHYGSEWPEGRGRIQNRERRRSLGARKWGHRGRSRRGTRGPSAQSRHRVRIRSTAS